MTGTSREKLNVRTVETNTMAVHNKPRHCCVALLRRRIPKIVDFTGTKRLY